MFFSTKNKIFILDLLLAIFFCFSSCCLAKNSRKDNFSNEKADTLYCIQLGQVINQNDCVIIQKDIDLKGSVLKLPNNVVLQFQDGIIRNGTIIGNNTKVFYKKACFSNITIKGTWNIPIISTDMFDELSNDNDLQLLFSLTNPELDNKVIIKDGIYYVSAYENDKECLRVSSNTLIQLDGIIRLRPNNYSHSYIVRMTGDNIKLYGSGAIIGDKQTHTGKEGEWGMGVFVWDGTNITIKDVNVRDCWGDCIYVGGNSNNITIDNCHLDNGRRQGISVTSVGVMVIKDCEITNVGGTAPGYGIDIEPNAGKRVGYVTINNIECVNCKGGFLAYGYEKKARIGKIQIENSQFLGCSKEPVRFYGCDSVILSHCTIEAVKGKKLIHKESVAKYIENNTIQK